LQLASIWSWGWAAFNPAGNDPDKPKAACAWLWTRDRSLCDAPALAGTSFNQSLDVGATLPTGTLCLLGQTKLLASDVSALGRLTGGRDLAFSAELQHAVLVQAAPIDPKRLAQAEVDTILDHFGGSRSAYRAALARGKATPQLARRILADELRRISIESTLRVAPPGQAGLRRWYDTHAASPSRPVRTARPVSWLGNLRKGVAVAGVAPGRLLALDSGATVTIDGVRVTALGETAPLGAFPFALAAPSLRRALLAEERYAAFAAWARTRENQSLASLACQHDQTPQPAAVDLTDWLPYLSLG
jgi:hypothetical protein